jgi:hypothetical protein
MFRSLVVTAALAASTAVAQSRGAGTVDAPQQDLGALLEKSDQAYAQRDQPGALDAVQSALDEASRLAPDDYGVLWREARLAFWRADDPSLDKKDKSRIGKQSWEFGDRAVKANPDRVEGWNYAAAGMGNYALGIGVFAALRQGIEGKFKDRLSHAEKIDPGFGWGAIQTAWGRFYYELPWPKYDAKKSERALLDALERNPDNVRARVYLADLYHKEGKRGPEHDQLEKAIANPPGRYDEPEERRWQEVARQRLAGK